MSIRQQVYDVVLETLEYLRAEGEIAVDSWPRFSVDPPKSPAHGDFAVNAAMVLAKKVSQRPRDLAERIASLLVTRSDLIAAAEVAGPGFINARLADDVWRAVIGAVEEQAGRYGLSPSRSRGSVNVEYVSANPTGPLHVGHGRGAVVGDALARLLSAAGYDVTREYYVNDHGNQVDQLARSLHLRYQELHGREVEFPPNAYPAEYVREIARDLVEAFGDRFLDAPEEEWLQTFRDRGMEANLNSIREDLRSLGVSFDVWSLESALHTQGLVQRLVEDLGERGAIYVAEQSEAASDKIRRQDSKAAKHAGGQRGGTFARLSQFGDSDDRIVLRRDGSPVYLTSDLAYHREKCARGFDLCIDVFGADHFSHTRTLRAGLGAVGEDPLRLEFVLTQIVRLIRGGKEVRISKRAGTIELLSDLVEAVGADATRFFFLMRAPSSQFDFDLDVATASGLDNPVFYVQYGHARACAIFRKAAGVGVTYGGFDADTARHLTLPEELGLLRKMATLPDVIVDAAESREPHRIVYFAESLIRDFHSYYTRYSKSERVLSEDKCKTQARLGLVNALRQVLHNALSLLGVSAPDHMAPLTAEDEDSA